MPKKVLLGVTGCIAAYKMTECVRSLIKSGHEVKVILTPCATKFVTETSMATLSQNRVYADLFTPENGWFPQHIALAEWADVILVAPLSADMLAKIAMGFGDHLLLSALLAYAGPVILAPSMSDQMYANPMVQSNLERLREVDRYCLVQPDAGFLACLANGVGRLPDIEALCREVESL